MTQVAAATAAVAELARRLGPSARRNEPMARHTSLRVGGAAELFVVARTGEELIQAVDHAWQCGVPWRVIGSASNLLVADEGVPGLVVKASGGLVSTSVQREGETLVRVDAGCILAAVARTLALQGLEGLEWAMNVPGTIGGAVVDNSGAFGSSISEHLIEAEVYVPPQGVCRLGTDDLGLGYRTSRLKRGELGGAVVTATFRVTPGSVDILRTRIRDAQRRRRATQPTGFSLGSVFANPAAGFAGELIERAGLKGTRIGDAEVSPVHANFMLNLGRARARDVVELMTLVQRRVWETTGQWLSSEVQLLGQFHPDLVRPGASTADRSP